MHTRAPHGKLAFVHVDLLQYPHDDNLTITLLLKTLVTCSQKELISENLYIQMDNTSRENKIVMSWHFAPYWFQKRCSKRQVAINIIIN